MRYLLDPLKLIYSRPWVLEIPNSEPLIQDDKAWNCLANILLCLIIVIKALVRY